MDDIFEGMVNDQLREMAIQEEEAEKKMPWSNTTLEVNNRLPDEFTYEKISEALLEAAGDTGDTDWTLRAGNKTWVTWGDAYVDGAPISVAIQYHDTVVARLYANGSVVLNSGGWKSATTMDRMNRAIAPLGYRVTGGTVSGWSGRRHGRDAWKLYRMRDGSYRDFFDGMVVAKDE